MLFYGESLFPCFKTAPSEILRACPNALIRMSSCSLFFRVSFPHRGSFHSVFRMLRAVVGRWFPPFVFLLFLSNFFYLFPPPPPQTSHEGHVEGSVFSREVFQFFFLVETFFGQSTASNMERWTRDGTLFPNLIPLSVSRTSEFVFYLPFPSEFWMGFFWRSQFQTFFRSVKAASLLKAVSPMEALTL